MHGAMIKIMHKIVCVLGKQKCRTLIGITSTVIDIMIIIM